MRPYGTPHPQIVGKCYQIGLVVVLGKMLHYFLKIQFFQNFPKILDYATMWHTPPQIVGKMLPNRYGSDFKHNMTISFKIPTFPKISKKTGLCDHMAHPPPNCGKMLPNWFGSDFGHNINFVFQNPQFFKVFKNFLIMRPYGTPHPNWWGNATILVW